MCRLDMVVAETYGEEQESILQTARLWQQNVSVIIGPVETCVHEVRQQTKDVHINDKTVLGELQNGRRKKYERLSNS